MDLISYANKNLTQSTKPDPGTYDLDPVKCAAYASLMEECANKPSTKRVALLKSFIMEHCKLSPEDVDRAFRRTGSDYRIMDTDPAHSEVQKINSVTLSGIIKYMPEQSLQFAALLQCLVNTSVHDVFIWYGLDRRECVADTNYGTGYSAGLALSFAPHVVKLHNQVMEEAGQAPAVTTADEPATSLPDLDPAVQAMLDATLSGAGVPSYDEIKSQIEAAANNAGNGLTVNIGNVAYASGSDDVPDLDDEVKSSRLSELGLPTNHDLPVNVLSWSFDHPGIPAKIEGYHFRPELVDSLAYALTVNERIYLSGHTGTGKSSLVDQVAAYLNWPVVRVNFDSEISRMDLIGREVLTQEDGTTVSKFVDGILPTAMQQPCILLLDEIDFVRPDVAYVLQRLLETDGELVITEDGGRRVKPHPLFRIVATGNTKGQGDETGHYTGARTQSAAFLDRFCVWADVPYLDAAQITEMTGKSEIAHYYAEHVAAFIDGQVNLPLSPRGVTAWNRMARVVGDVKTAFNATLLNRATEADRAVMSGIADRVLAA